MCTHGRFVTNRYTRQQFWCKCGKCKSCLQEKADARANRIRHEYDGKSDIYFVTLTYDRLSVPYFTQEAFDSIYKMPSGARFGLLPVYRNSFVTWSVNKQKYIRKYEKIKVADVPVCLDDFDKRSFWFRWLKKQPGKIGVCYFKDVQDFNKRLRINLKRSGYNEKIKIFDCTEYGGSTLRPHAHLLIFGKGLSQIAFHDLVCKSWSFGRRIRNPKSCELVTKDPASYVSSYVNSGQKLSPFLARYFASKHSSSKLFGHGLRAFSLEEIKKKVDTGTLNYFTSRLKDNVPTVFDFPLPKYVINRWFPLFKGYSRLTSHQVLEFLARGFDSGYLERVAKQYDLNNPYCAIDYQPGKKRVDLGTFLPSDVYRITTRLMNSFKSYHSVFPGSTPFDYARDYEKTWRVWKSTCYRYFRLDESVPEFYKFDNMCFQSEDVQKDWYSRGAPLGAPFVVDNNDKPPVKERSLYMTQKYDKYCKTKEITSFALADCAI